MLAAFRNVVSFSLPPPPLLILLSPSEPPRVAREFGARIRETNDAETPESNGE